MARWDAGAKPPSRGRRCSAHAKHSGEQCQNFAIVGGTVCMNHGGATPQVRGKANERIRIARDLACEELTAQLRRHVVEPRETVAATRDLVR